MYQQLIASPGGRVSGNGSEHASLAAIEVDGDILTEAPNLGFDSSGSGNHWAVNNLVADIGLSTAAKGMDVLTWTGDGGRQVIGGEVYSNTGTLTVNNSNSNQAGSFAAVFNGNQVAQAADAYGFTNGAMDFTWTPATPIPYTSKVRVWTGFSGGSIYLNGGSAVSSANNNWTTLVSGSSGTISFSQIYRWFQRWLVGWCRG